MLPCLLVLGAVFLFPKAVRSRSWAVEELPNPQSEPQACGRAAPSRVCDPEKYLEDSPEVQKALNVLEADYSYPGCGGYEMAIVVVSAIAGGGDDEGTSRFAKAVIDQWGVGKPECNNGIALVLAIADRKIFIATGRGAQEKLPDKELQLIIERMRSPLRDGEYAGAAEQCISDIAQVLDGKSFIPGWLSFDVLLFPLMCVFVLLASLWRRFHQTRRYTACKRKLTHIERDHATEKAKKYQVTSCAICLDLFEETKHLEQELLVCGHQFHQRCLASWQHQRGTCPICRQPTTSAATLSGQESLSANSLARRAYADDDYHFRLARVRHYYPDYVSNDMLHRWTSAGHNGQLVADTCFVRNSPSYNSGGSGTSSSNSNSFGGGCSSGGGGAGGGW